MVPVEVQSRKEGWDAPVTFVTPIATRLASLLASVDIFFVNAFSVQMQNTGCETDNPGIIELSGDFATNEKTT